MCVLVLVNKSARVFFFDMRKTNWRFRYKNFPSREKQKQHKKKHFSRFQITRSYMSLSSSSSLLGHEARRLLRRLLRARLALFHGDEKALQASAIEIRSHFDQHKDITDAEDIRKRIKEGKEAEMFLTTNVLQGKMNERGNFETKLKSADPDKETWEVPKEAK